MDSEKKAHLKETAVEEMRLLLVIFLYLAAFFVAFETYRRLISREFGVNYFRYGFALLEALIIAKVILIGKAIGLGRKEARRTLAWSVFRASLAYAALVAVFEVLEHVVEGLFHGKTFGASVETLLSQGAYEIFGKTIILLVAFIPFFAFWELDRALGGKKVLHIFFKKAVVSG